MEAVGADSSFASLMDDEDEEGGEYDEDQEVLRVDATQEVDESLLVRVTSHPGWLCTATPASPPVLATPLSTCPCAYDLPSTHRE